MTTQPMHARAPIFSYVLLAYAFTWGIGLPLMAARRGWTNFAVSEHWEAVAAFGPFVAALCVSAAVGGRAACIALLRGLTRWRVGTRWLVFTLGSPFALLGAALLIVRLTTGEWPPLAAAGRLAAAEALLGLVVVSGLVQGVGEEPGWRGFMLPRLRLRHTALTATLILFPAWLFWHLPAFLGRPEFGVAQGIGFALGVLSAAFWLTFIVEHTGSTLMAVAWHALINIVRGVAMAISMPLFFTLSALVMAGGLAILAWSLLSGRAARAAAGATPADHPGTI